MLAEISDLLGNGEGDLWRERAATVKARFAEYLWDSERAAAYDRDKYNKPMYVLSLENVKCMYHGILSQEMADEFIERHLMNPEEFFTPLPLPNIAANDLCFRLDDVRTNMTPEIRAVVDANKAADAADNSWSGPVQGLCHQRAIDALLGYGHHAELTVIARRWIANLIREGIFTQQYDPYTGKHSPGIDGYGPTALSAMEDTVHLVGIDYASGRFTLSNGKEEADSRYTQHLFGKDFTLVRRGGVATLLCDGEEILSFRGSARLITDENLTPLTLCGMEPTAETVTLTMGGASATVTVAPNEIYTVKDGTLTLCESHPYSGPRE